MFSLTNTSEHSAYVPAHLTSCSSPQTLKSTSKEREEPAYEWGREQKGAQHSNECPLRGHRVTAGAAGSRPSPCPGLHGMGVLWGQVDLQMGLHS